MTRNAVANAASIAGLLLTTESIVVEKKEPPAPAAGGHGHGHGHRTGLASDLDLESPPPSLAAAPKVLSAVAHGDFRRGRQGHRIRSQIGGGL